MPEFNWHSGDIQPHTQITPTFRVTPKVRRLFVSLCGPTFTVNRDFRAWLQSATGKTLAEAATEWQRRHAS